MGTNLSPFVVPTIRYCWECGCAHKAEEMREEKHTSGLTIFLCRKCDKPKGPHHEHT